LRIGVLNNLRAGRSHAGVSKILEFLKAHPDVVHVETDQAHAVPEVMSEFARQRVDLLVVNGGDGTLQFALTQILHNGDFERVPMVAPLRGGRTNMTALDLGADRNPVRGLADVIAAARSGRIAERIVTRPVLRIASNRRGEVEYGMFYGAGVIQRAIGLTHRLFPPGRSQGVLGAGIVTATLIAKLCARQTEGILTPDKLQLVLDGEGVPQGEFNLMIATSLRRLFLRMNPFWGRGPGGVRFTSVATGAERTAAAVPGILRGRPRAFVTTEAGYTSRNAERAEIRLDCGYTVDGEIFQPQPDEHVRLSADRRVSFVRA
jgi:diacylglycerol kinase (ATP)